MMKNKAITVLLSSMIIAGAVVFACDNRHTVPEEDITEVVKQIKQAKQTIDQAKEQIDEAIPDSTRGALADSLGAASATLDETIRQAGSWSDLY